METKNMNTRIAQLNLCTNSEELADFITRYDSINPENEPDDDIDW